MQYVLLHVYNVTTPIEVAQVYGTIRKTQPNAIMPKVAHAFEAEIRRSIRDALALDPLMTIKKLMVVLEKKFSHSFDFRYISRLVKKVNKEALPNLEREKLEPRLRQMRETLRIGRENLLKIAYGQPDYDKGPKPTFADRNAAWRTIAMMEKLQMDVEIDIGLYAKQNPGALVPGDFRHREIPAEILEAMMLTARLWKLPENLTRKIEAPAAPPPKEVEAVVTPVESKPIEQHGPKTIATGIIPDPVL